MEMKKYPCAFMRGGTSKALLFNIKDLPEDRALWPELYLGAMGSPDIRQVDGMGGAVPSMSKLAVIGPSTKKGADVDYTFVQVSIDEASVDMKSNCGNISSTAGPLP